MFESFIILLSLSALFSFVNFKFLKLPGTIGVTILALLMAIPLGILEVFDPKLFHRACQVVTTIDFRTLLLDVMLSFMLFAGAMHVRINDLQQERKAIISFATLGVLISTAVVGTLLYFGSQLIGISISLGYCMLFGALISPTDPIAVLAILSSLGVDKKLETRIAGESLFNDGVGFVVFLSILNILNAEGAEFSFIEIIQLFGEEAIGGLLYGAIIGFLGYYLIKQAQQEPKIEVMISVALCLGGYALASFLHVSGSLAMVVAGLIVGNKMNSKSFDVESRKELRMFWEVLDEIFNTILFVLIGLEILIISFEANYILAGLLSILIVLLARFISVQGILILFKLPIAIESPKVVKVMTWGGLRGGISVALAISLDPGPFREYMISITYIVVVFSILAQGLTMKPLLKKLRI